MSFGNGRPDLEFQLANLHTTSRLCHLQTLLQQLPHMLLLHHLQKMMWVLRQIRLSLATLGLSICVPVSAPLSSLIYQILRIIVPSECIRFLWRTGAMRIRLSNQSPCREIWLKCLVQVSLQLLVGGLVTKGHHLWWTQLLFRRIYLSCRQEELWRQLPNPWLYLLILTVRQRGMCRLVKMSVRCCLVHLHQPNKDHTEKVQTKNRLNL